MFSDNAVYIESWGPEYHGSGKIKLWFEEWNTRGTVLQWNIKQFFHKDNQTIVEWYFKNKMDAGNKGFDSSYGGYPSFIFQNGLLQPLPIPSSYETIRYSDIYSPYDGLTLYDTMRSLNAAIKDKTWVRLTKDQTCHLDPDLGFDSLSRCGEWVGCFGQEGAAQTVLRKQLVGSGDIFLFFGWFNHCYPSDHGLKFRKGDDVIFGYLQVEKVLYTAEEEIPQ